MMIADALHAFPAMAILRGVTPDEIVSVGTALIQEGWRAIEVPLNRPLAFESIERLAAIAPPEVSVGAGTLTFLADIARLVDCGASFAVSPHFDPDLVGACRAAGLDTIPGVLTPSELHSAYRMGERLVKIFPMDALSTAAVAGMLATAPPGISAVAVGGVDGDNLTQVLAAGPRAAGIGSWLYQPGDSADLVRQRAQGVAYTVAKWRAGGQTEASTQRTGAKD